MHMVLLGISAMGDHTHSRSDHAWYTHDGGLHMLGVIILGISAMVITTYVIRLCLWFYLVIHNGDHTHYKSDHAWYIYKG